MSTNQLLFINSEDAFTSKSFEVMYAEGQLAESSSLLRVVEPDSVTGSITLEVQGNIVADKYRGRSDARIKTDIQDLNDALATVKRLTGKMYTLNNDRESTYGFIAQDVQQVLPTLVKDDGEYLSISYFELLPFIVEAIKQLDEKLTTISSRIN